MASKYTILVVLLLSLISLQLIKLGHGSGVHTSIHCLEFEREALLQGFAKGFNLTEYPFSSWVGKNCCRWEGVYCDNTTGHVTGLEVGWLSGGKMNQSLLGLKHLNYLALFGNVSIPPFIGDFKELKVLNLDFSDGTMLQQLGNLSSLQYLYLYSYYEHIVDNVHWLSRLTSLQELGMELVSFDKASGWLDALNMLPSLRSIYFSNCVFGSFPLSLAHVNFTSILDISFYLSLTKSRIPNWLFQLSNLQDLDLSYTDFQGPIPAAIGNLTSLEFLDFSGTSHLSAKIPQTLSSLCKVRSLYLSKSNFNQRLDDLRKCFSGCIRNSLNELDLYNASLRGNLPDWIASLKNLTTLLLSMNSLSGPLPRSLGQVSQLAYLDLSHNSLEGELTEEHFANLTRLKHLVVEFNFLVLNVSSDWVPPFQLEYIDMSSCLVGPKFPSWLRTQWKLTELYLSNSGILDSIPPNISKIFPDIVSLDLSINSMNGSIPSSLCDLVNLTVLDISNNNLSGELPPCKKHFPKSLSVLILSNNNIMGGIPGWLCSASTMNFLHLSNNYMSGDFPPSLKSCKKLVSLDLGGNRFSGSIPTWVAESLPNLERLRLRSNMFMGEIPKELSQIENLHIIDLSHNNFSGAIPSSFGNFSIMLNGYIAVVYYFSDQPLFDKMILDTKGREDMYERRPLLLITLMDLSENNLSGSIPEELISLPALMSLNLSGNHLTGEISRKIGNMLQLDSLDLSMNELSGAIPSTLTNLSSLSFLNVSYNNLSGRIPIGRQLETINTPYSYIGNPFLCGLPLMKTCEGDGTIDRVSKDADGDGNTQAPGISSEGEDEMFWFYLGIAPGYAVGFWIVLGMLFLNKTWRTVYFQFVDNSYDRISVAILLSFERLKRRFLQG